METEEIGTSFFDEYLNLDSCGKQSELDSVPPTPGGGSPQMNPSENWQSEPEAESDSDESVILDSNVLWRSESVKAMAETVGAQLDDDSSMILCQTVINRLRHLTLLAMQFSRHGNSDGVRTVDVTKAEKILEGTSSMGFSVATEIPDYLDAGDFCVELEGPSVEVDKLGPGKQSLKLEPLSFISSHSYYHDSLSEAFNGKETELIQNISASNGNIFPINPALIKRKETESNSGKKEATSKNDTACKSSAKRPRSVTSENQEQVVKKAKMEVQNSANGASKPGGRKTNESSKRSSANSGIKNGKSDGGSSASKLNLSEDSDLDSSDEEDFVPVQEAERVKKIHITNEIPEYYESAAEANTPGSVPSEWMDYVQSFIIAFHDNTEVVPFKSAPPLIGELDETNEDFEDSTTCSCTEFDMILRDVQNRGAFPVLHILCDFFQNYVKTRRKKRDVNQMRRIISFVNAMIACPIRCRIYHLEPMLSTLKDMFMIPSHAEVLSNASSTLLKIADFSENPYNLEVVTWITKYVNGTLSVGSQLTLSNLTTSAKTKICGAVHLASGLLQRELKPKRILAWIPSIIRICRAHHIVLQDSVGSKKKSCSTDCCLEDALLTFIRLYAKLKQRSKVGATDNSETLNELYDIYGEKLTFLSGEVPLDPMVPLMATSRRTESRPVAAKPHRTGWVLKSNLKKRITIPYVPYDPQKPPT